MLPDVTKNIDAPNGSTTKDDFRVIMELTTEEKQELLQLWKERLYSGG